MQHISNLTRKQVSRIVRERIARESVSAKEKETGRRMTASQIAEHLEISFDYWSARERLQIALNITKGRDHA